jgi:methylmalonyl-CoA/ethylmalonyl-CoA epimerase
MINKLHHIGIVVKNLLPAIEPLNMIFNINHSFGPIIDESRKSRLFFLQKNEDILIELIEPLNNESPVYLFSLKGGGLHHICFEVSDINKFVLNARKNGAIIVSNPAPAIAFGNKRVAFIYEKNIGLIEVKES